MNKTGFQVDRNTCMGCGLCTRVCPGGILSLDGEGKVQMAEFEEFGWKGCWKCEHCLAVCPAGALSIFGHRPEDSLSPVKAADAAPVLDALIANRHSSRRYQDRNVDPGVIRDMIGRLANAPNGGNKQQVEFTLIDDKERMKRLRSMAMLEIPEDHYTGMFIGFGYPEISYKRGVQKTVDPGRIHRPAF